MNFDDAPPGFPFNDDYPPYDRDEGCGPLREAIDRQAAELAQRRNEPWAQRQLIAAVQRRRRDRADLVQFDTLPRKDGFDTLLAHGEILVTVETLRDPGARGFLDSAGMQEAPLGCDALAGRLV